MKFERKIMRLSRVLLVLGGGLGAIGALLIGASTYIDHDIPDPGAVNAERPDCEPGLACGPIRYTVAEQAPDAVKSASPVPEEVTPPAADRDNTATGSRNSPDLSVSSDSLTATNGASLADSQPSANGPGSVDAEAGAISNTLTITERSVLPRPAEPPVTSPLTTTLPANAAGPGSTDSYTSTVQVHPRPEIDPADKEPGATLLQAQTLPPVEAAGCLTTSSASFDLIPIQGPPADRPDFAHGDFSLSLRGYAPISESLELVSFYGATDPDAPQLPGLFQPNRASVIKTVYRVNEWIWDPGRCGGRVHGCPGPLITDWDVTLAGLATTPGEPISIPKRSAEIYSGGYKALVLYAEERQITLGYSGRDTVAAGYIVHIVDVCVDPNLLALYRAQNSTDGWRVTGLLPALRNDQALGVAFGGQVKVAIRDNGSFMDPRSGKDWWQGY